ncbi:TIGR01244 family phosphatase [Nostoc sp. CHAB 5834]|nr:TIGR01244 family phosphatase [Nostoc sp. CHAB 5834]
MTQLNPLSASVSVGPQLQPSHMTALAAQGYASVINNRPDGEEPGQPSSSEIEAAATAAGLAYLHAPIRGMPDEQTVAQVAERLKADTEGNARTAMFCRSGMRSSAAWAMAQRLEGADADDLRAAAASAGYDLGRLPL